MNWYQGNIAEAVAMSKTKNAIFVVYVAGSDEMTQKLTNFINEEIIKTKLESDDFVAIKIESGTQAYMQFAKIYQVVPVPSIFFIGNSGTPLEVGTGVIDSVVELEQKINNVLVTSGKSGTNAASTSASLIEAEQASSQDAQSSISNALPLVVDAKTTDEIVCEGDVCYRRPKEPTKTEVPVEVKSTEATNGDSAETDSHMEETRKLLEQKRRERIELEKKQEKERELRRRRDGKETQNVQSWQKEQELKDLKDNIRRERLEEQAVRERIRAQIAGDRAERAQKFSAKVDSGTTNDPVLSQPNNNNSNEARLQFRLSTGDTKTQNFNCEDELSVVRQFVKSELLPGTGIRDFILATSYPKRELSGENDKKSLVELELFPSAVILVIGKESNSNPAAIIARSGGIINIFTTLFWAVLSPVFAVFGYVKSFGSRGGGADGEAENAGAQKRANEEQNAQHDAAKRRNLDRFLNSPSTSKDSSSAPAASSSTPSNTLDNESNASKPYRRYVGGSNIHRLTDKQKDSDDENATWNGNSTQQQ